MTKRGQSIIEYILIIILVVLGIIYGGPYVLRSLNAYFRLWDTGVQDSFEENLASAPPDAVPNITSNCETIVTPGECGGAMGGRGPEGQRHFTPTQTGDCFGFVPAPPYWGSLGAPGKPDCSCSTPKPSGCGTTAIDQKFCDPNNNTCSPPQNQLPLQPNTGDAGTSCYYGQEFYTVHAEGTCPAASPYCERDPNCAPKCTGATPISAQVCNSSPSLNLRQNQPKWTYVSSCPKSIPIGECDFTCPNHCSIDDSPCSLAICKDGSTCQNNYCGDHVTPCSSPCTVSGNQGTCQPGIPVPGNPDSCGQIYEVARAFLPTMPGGYQGQPNNPTPQSSDPQNANSPFLYPRCYQKINYVCFHRHYCTLLGSCDWKKGGEAGVEHTNNGMASPICDEDGCREATDRSDIGVPHCCLDGAWGPPGVNQTTNDCSTGNANHLAGQPNDLSQYWIGYHNFWYTGCANDKQDMQALANECNAPPSPDKGDCWSPSGWTGTPGSNDAFTPNKLAPQGTVFDLVDGTIRYFDTCRIDAGRTCCDCINNSYCGTTKPDPKCDNKTCTCNDNCGTPGTPGSWCVVKLTTKPA